MRRVLLVCLILIVASAQTVRPGVELLLRDGTTLQGADVRKEGGIYVLQLESGEAVTLPVELVEEVRLIGPAKETEMHPGIVKAEPQILGGAELDPKAPTELRHAKPEVLAGHEIRPATPREQTAALGPPAQFQKGIIDNEWRPETDWNMDPHSQNNFAPSTWSDDIVDSNWTPQSAFDKNNDVMKSGESSFTESIVDNNWEPTDAFKNQGWGGR